MSPKQYERGLDIIPIAQVAGLRLREGKSPPEREPLSPQLPYTTKQAIQLCRLQCLLCSRSKDVESSMK